MEHTLCWDCAKASGSDRFPGGACEWAERLQPVAGWSAVETVKKEGTDDEMRSYIVLSCPKFERDAWGGGLKWIRETSDDTQESSSEKTGSSWWAECAGRRN